MVHNAQLLGMQWSCCGGGVRAPRGLCGWWRLELATIYVESKAVQGPVYLYFHKHQVSDL